MQKGKENKNQYSLQNFDADFINLVSLAAVFSLVTQRSSPKTAAHIRTTFLTATSTNHHSGYICRELCAPK